MSFRRPRLTDHRSALKLLSRGLLVLLVSFSGEPPPAVAQQVQTPEEGEMRRFYPDDPLWQDPDRLDIAPVRTFNLRRDYDFVQNTFSDPARSDGPALNVNTLGEVPDSSWFTNRLGHRGMTVAEVARGPDTVDGPAPGVWTVTGRPEAGLTPKFTIRDARGDTYLIKLDPALLPELPSSVEIISTKIFHAIGYHVPEDYLVDVDPSQLEIDPGRRFSSIRADGSRYEDQTWNIGSGINPGTPMARCGHWPAGTFLARPSVNSATGAHGPTIRTTSIHTRDAGSCGATRSLVRGSTTMTPGASTPSTPTSRKTGVATSVTTCSTSGRTWGAPPRPRSNPAPATSITWSRARSSGDLLVRPVVAGLDACDIPRPSIGRQRRGGVLRALDVEATIPEPRVQSDGRRRRVLGGQYRLPFHRRDAPGDRGGGPDQRPGGGRLLDGRDHHAPGQGRELLDQPYQSARSLRGRWHHRHWAGTDLRQRRRSCGGRPGRRQLQGSLVGAGQPLRPGDTRG